MHLTNGFMSARIPEKPKLNQRQGIERSSLCRAIDWAHVGLHASRHVGVLE